jgi:transposase InsO family protein
VFPYVLLVRDLASSRQLLAMPALAPDASMAMAALQELFLEHGPPLVLKSANGSSFLALAFQELLAGLGVTPLLSPPVTPEYNGSIEAGNGSLKAHARLEALRHGRMIWSCDDLEAACRCANTCTRPWGDHGPSPDQRWETRHPITHSERQNFQKTLDQTKKRVMIEQDLHASDLARRELRAAVDRTATRQALESLGYLMVLGGPIRPPLKSPDGHFIS